MEHQLDRVMNIYSGTHKHFKNMLPKPVAWEFVGDNGYRFRVGKYSKSWFYCENPVSSMCTCRYCGFFGSKKKFAHWGCFGYSIAKKYDLEIFLWEPSQTCFSCANKVRALENKLIELDNLRIEINNAKRKFYEASKDHA